MNQPSLFDYVPSRNVPTSIAAAKKMASTAYYWENKVLDALLVRPMITEELVNHIGGEMKHIQPATSRLRRKGKIQDSKLRRPNNDQNMCIVWRIL